MIDVFYCVCVCVLSEEKTEQLMDSKHEGERLDQELQKLKQEVRTHLYIADVYVTHICMERTSYKKRTKSLHFTCFVFLESRQEFESISDSVLLLNVG